MIVKNSVQGYNYKYADLAEINKVLEENKITYRQYTQTEPNGDDYIMTIVIDKDGKESKPMRGAKIIEPELAKSNAAQIYGSALTYARRYSLLMCLGLATDDDDGNSMNGVEPQKKNNKPQENTMALYNIKTPMTDGQKNIIDGLMKELQITTALRNAQLQKLKLPEPDKLTEGQANLYIDTLKKAKAIKEAKK